MHIYLTCKNVRAQRHALDPVQYLFTQLHSAVLVKSWNFFRISKSWVC